MSSPVSSDTSSSRRLDSLVAESATRTLQYEGDLKDLEAKLSEHLSNARTIDTSLREVYASIKQNAARADRAVDIHLPRVHRTMDDALEALSQLEETLPVTRAQVAEIRAIHDSGRVKAQYVVDDLTWLTTSFYDRWRITIFTKSAPVSPRLKLVMRLLFFACFMTCMYIVFITIRGAYKAHRSRFVWGDRLIS